MPDYAGMDAPSTVVERVRAHQQFERSINELCERLEKKMPVTASTLLAIAEPEKKAELVRKYVQLGKHIERNIKAFKTSQHKAMAILKELESPKPNWPDIERALDRALEIAARIERDLKAHDLAIDQILATCRGES